MNNKQILKIIIWLIIPIAILSCSPPAGLTLQAWQIFAMYVMAIVGFLLQPFAAPVVIISVLSISSLLFKNLPVLMQGYVNNITWLLFTAYWISTAFHKTGLGERIALILIRMIGRTTLGLGYATAITELILAPVIPSSTARSGALLFPIIKSISETLKSYPGPSARKIGAYLILLLYQTSLMSGSVFITALTPNLLMASFGSQILNVSVDWWIWFKASFVPILLPLIFLPFLVYKLFPPELKSLDNKTLSGNALAELGPMSQKEWILVVLFIFAFFGWSAGRLLKIDSVTVGLIVISVSLLTNVITWKDVLKTEGAWSIFIWFGGLLGLAGALAKANFFDWLAQTLLNNFDFVSMNSFILLIVLSFTSVAIRYLFVSSAAFAATIVPVLFTIGHAANVPPMLLFFLIAFGVGYGGCLTNYSSETGPILYGAGYHDMETWFKVGAAVVLCIYLIQICIGIPYWKFLGLG